MSVALLNDTTVTDFLNDTETFDSCVTERFKKLDLDGDGFLNPYELRVGFRILPMEFELSDQDDAVDDLLDLLFRQFDVDNSGGIDPQEFKCLTTEIMLAMARGIGNLPIQVALEQDSLLMKAVQHEQAKQQPP